MDHLTKLEILFGALSFGSMFGLFVGSYIKKADKKLSYDQGFLDGSNLIFKHYIHDKLTRSLNQKPVDKQCTTSEKTGGDSSTG